MLAMASSLREEKIGKGSQQPSLFELRTLALITIPEKSADSFYAAGTVNHCVLATGNKCNLFHGSDVLTLDCCFDAKNLVCEVVVLPAVEPIFVVIDASRLILVINSLSSAPVRELPHKLDRKSELESFLVSHAIVNDACIIACGTLSGQITLVTLPNWSVVVNTEKENITSVVPNILNECKIEYLNASHQLNSISMCTNGELMLFFENSSSIGIVDEQLNIFELEIFESEVFKAIEITQGYFIMLQKDGSLCFFDALTYACTQVIPGDKQIIEDVMVQNAMGALHELDQIACIVRDETGSRKLELRSLVSEKVLFTMPVQEKARFLPCNSDSASILRVAEPQFNESNCDLRVYELFETQPEVILNRLIASSQFDAALDFAHKHKINDQVVYEAQASYLATSVCFSDDLIAIKGFVDIARKIKNIDKIGECCMIFCFRVRNPYYVIPVLEFCESMQFTEGETIEGLYNIRYALTSFRLLYGDKCDNAIAAKMWDSFIQNGRIMNVFDELLKRGSLPEVRLMWQRHVRTIISDLEASQVEDNVFERFLGKVFECVRRAIQIDIANWQDCVSFLEYEVVLELPADELIMTLRGIWDILKSLVVELERQLPENFPENALYAVSTINRLVSRLQDRATTPVQQAILAFAARNIAFHGSSENIINEANAVLRRLTSIKELKDDFNCRISFDESALLDEHTIANRILDQCVSTAVNMREKIQRYAIIYMHRKNLSADDTFHRFIQHKLNHFSKCKMFFVGVETGLTIIDMISSLQTRYRALINFVHHVSVPWESPVSKAVQQMLTDKDTNAALREEMKNLCLKADIALVLDYYGLPLSSVHIENYVGSFCSMQKAIVFMLSQDNSRIKTPKTLIERENDALKVAELYNQLMHREIMSPARVSTLFIFILLRGGFASIRNILEYLAAFEMNKASQHCDRVLDVIESNLTVPLMMLENAKQERVLHCDLYEAIVLRFRRSDKQRECTLRDVIAIRKLQVKHNLFFTLTSLNKDEAKSKVLQNLIDKAEISHDFNYTEFIEIATFFRFTPDEIFVRALKGSNAQLQFDFTTLAIIESALIAVPRFSLQLARATVEAIDIVLFAIYQCSLAPSHSANSEYDKMLQLGCSLHELIPLLVEAIDDSYGLLETLIRVHGYTYLLVKLSQKLICENSVVVDSVLSESSEVLLPSDKRSKHYVPKRIMSLSPRVGFYDISCDQALFEKFSITKKFGQVARSVTEAAQSELETSTEFRNDWETLLDDLNSHSQALLQFNAHVYAIILYRDKVEFFHDLAPTVFVLFQKIVQSHPADIWLGVQVLSTLHREAISEKLREMRNSRGSQPTINLLRISQVFVHLFNAKAEYGKIMKSFFRKALWQKRLLKNGIPTAICSKVSVESLSNIIATLADVSASPILVKEFFEDFELPRSSLLLYGSALFRVASNMEISEKTFELCQKANMAIQFANEPKSTVFEALRDFVYVLNPYNYEVLNEILCLLNDFASDDTHNTFICRFSQLLTFLRSTRRSTDICHGEFVWFKERERLIELAQAATGSSTNMARLVRMRYAEKPVGGIIEESIIGHLIRNVDSELLKQMPSLAKERLPLHVFLFEVGEDIVQNVKPIMDAEVTILNLKAWQQLREQLSLRNISRIEMLKTALCKSAQQAILENELSVTDSNTIRLAVLQDVNRPDVITVLSTCVQTVKTLTLKLSFLRLALKIGECWLQRPTDYGIDAEEENLLSDSFEPIRDMIYRLEIEKILSVVQINEPDKVDVPEKLINAIYEKHIDYSNADDVAKKQAAIDRIAELCKINLEDIELMLLDRWLADNRCMDIEIDLNDTMVSETGGSTITANSMTDKYVFPIFSGTVSRICHLITLKDRPSRAARHNKLFCLSKSDSADCYRRRILRLCVALRSLKDDELGGRLADDFASQIEVASYMRLFALASFPITMTAYMSIDKDQLVLNVLGMNTYREHINLVLSSLILDYPVKTNIVEKAIDRLARSQDPTLLGLVLQGCRSIDVAKAKNIGSWWTRVFESKLSILKDIRSDLAASEVQDVLLQLFAAPVPLGDRVMQLTYLLRQRGAFAAAHILPILVSPTKPLSHELITGGSPRIDLRFLWMELGEQQQPCIISSNDVNMGNNDDNDLSLSLDEEC